MRRRLHFPAPLTLNKCDSRRAKSIPLIPSGHAKNASGAAQQRRGSVYLPSSAAALEESGLTIFFHCVAPVCFSNPKGPSAQVVPVLRRTLFRKSWVSVGWSFQVSPPSWLIRKPLSVVIQPRLAPSKPMEVSQPETGVFLVSQVAPPSLVRNSCPAKPEIQPFLVSGKAIRSEEHTSEL